MSNVPNQIVVYEDTPNQIIVNQDPPNQIVVRLTTTSGNTRRHIHTQASPSTSWVINHSLGGKPSVTVVDSADTTVVGEVTYNSNSQVTVTFTQPFSGFAYLT